MVLLNLKKRRATNLAEVRKMSGIKTDQDLAKLEKEIGRKRLIPNLKDPEGERSYKTLGDETACNMFKAYFNNKMTIFLLLVQKKKLEPDILTALKAEIFFDDLFHHMLKSEYQNKYHRVFQWLKLFFRRFPYVKPVQKRKALEYINLIYRLFGMQFKLNI